MNTSLFLARRYLAASRREAQVGVVAAAALLGLTLGVAALVISLALLAGFQRHVKSRLLAETPHILVTPAGRGAFAAGEGLEARLRRVPGVTRVQPMVSGRLWIAIRGQALACETIGRTEVDGLVLDAPLASQLGAFPGDEVTLVSARTRLTPLGPAPIVASVKVTDLAPSSTGRRRPHAELPIAEARRLYALGEDDASGYELTIDDADRSAEVASEIRGRLGPTVAATTWQEANRALVTALKLERVVLFATVFLIVAVAGLNLAATSAVLAATRAGDAAVLAVLGAAPGRISSVFRMAGALVGAIGTLAGLAVGSAVALILDRTGAIPLPAQLYSLSHVPFRIEPLDLLAVGAFSLVWAFAAASIPARAAARLDVAEVLRAA